MVLLYSNSIINADSTSVGGSSEIREIGEIFSEEKEIGEENKGVDSKIKDSK